MEPMPDLDPSFDELVEAFEDPNHPGWSIGSAEGGWVIPSAEEWGQTNADSTPAQIAE